jgi:hypothetical protein
MAVWKRQGGRSHAGESFDFPAVYEHVALASLQGTLELAVHRVVLEHVGEVLVTDEGIVDGNELNIVPGEDDAGHQTTDTSES